MNISNVSIDAAVGKVFKCNTKIGVDNYTCLSQSLTSIMADFFGK